MRGAGSDRTDLGSDVLEELVGRQHGPSELRDETLTPDIVVSCLFTVEGVAVIETKRERERWGMRESEGSGDKNARLYISQMASTNRRNRQTDRPPSHPHTFDVDFDFYFPFRAGWWPHASHASHASHVPCPRSPPAPARRHWHVNCVSLVSGCSLLLTLCQFLTVIPPAACGLLVSRVSALSPRSVRVLHSSLHSNLIRHSGHVSSPPPATATMCRRDRPQSSFASPA